MQRKNQILSTGARHS